MKPPSRRSIKAPVNDTGYIRNQQTLTLRTRQANSRIKNGLTSSGSNASPNAPARPPALVRQCFSIASLRCTNPSTTTSVCRRQFAHRRDALLTKAWCAPTYVGAEYHSAGSSGIADEPAPRKTRTEKLRPRSCFFARMRTDQSQSRLGRVERGPGRRGAVFRGTRGDVERTRALVVSSMSSFRAVSDSEPMSIQEFVRLRVFWHAVNGCLSFQ